MSNKFRKNIFLLTIVYILSTIMGVSVLQFYFSIVGWHPSIGGFTVVCSMASVISFAAYVILLNQRTFSKEPGSTLHTTLPVVHEIQAAKVYEAIRQQHELEKMNVDKSILSAIRQYLDITLSPYLKDGDLPILFNNVCLWHHDKDAVLSPVDAGGRLSTLDLRHIAWNIGERCGWKGEERARFIKACFPIDMKDLEIETIRRNLRQKGTARIPLDIPETDCFQFHYSGKISDLTGTA